MTRLMSIIETKQEIHLSTSFVYPPIPIRKFDWAAIDDNTYDGAEDSHCPVGTGTTEIEAINDLLDWMEIQ